MNTDRPQGSPGPARTRFRLAVLLLVMSGAILASKFWEDSYIDSLRRDCTSLFRDRLIPATTLFHLVDEIHTKRHTLVRHLSTTTADAGSAGDRRPIEYEMGHHDASIEKLVAGIHETYLVDEESRLLDALQEALDRYRLLERELLAQHRTAEGAVYGEDIQSAFEEVRQELLGLTAVQQNVGQQLDRRSLASATHVTTLLYFQLGVAFVLGLLASGMAMSLNPSHPGRRHRLTKVGDDTH